MRWVMNKSGYVVKGRLRLNRVVMDRKLWETEGRRLEKSDEVDHQDGDKLNNCRENLRTATRSQQNCNRGISKRNKSGFIGVSFIKELGKYRAYLGGVYLGMFASPISAALFRDAEAKKHSNACYRLNFPDNH